MGRQRPIDPPLPDSTFLVHWEHDILAGEPPIVVVVQPRLQLAGTPNVILRLPSPKKDT